jgi:hypothetical protein
MENSIKEEKYAEKMLADYTPEQKGNSDYENLKMLETKVNRLPLVNAYVMGVVYVLTFGFALCLALKAVTLNGLDWLEYVLGGIGVLGMVGNYLVYKVFLAHQKAIYGNQIVELSKKILG